MDTRRIGELDREDLDLMVKKNTDYSGNSGDNISATGLAGVATRLMDKVSRLHTLSTSDGPANFESIDDTLRDIRNYGRIGSLLREGKWKDLPGLVYLAGPIDDIDRETATSWRIFVADLLRAAGISCYDPTGFSVGKLGHSKIIQINKTAIINSDLVIAYLGGTGRGFGTIREVEYARAFNKPVLLIIGNMEPSLYMEDCIIVKTLPEAIKLVTGYEV